MRILITGGAGFVGSHLAIELKKKYPTYAITCLDNLKRRGSELNIPRLTSLDIIFHHADIRNKEDLQGIPEFDCLIDASAEPSVLAGITSPIEQVVNNNLIGTLNCLELANKFKASFIFLSTSRVYPIKQLENVSYQEKETRFQWIDDQEQVNGVSSQGITEDFSLNGSRSFYGMTKLSSELLIQEYNELLGMKTVINRCGVITGPYQMGKVDQGVVVLWAARHFWKQSLGYFGYGGEGKQLRDILHVDDVFKLIDWQIHNVDQINGSLYNVGGGLHCSISLQELTHICEKISGNTIDIKKVVENRSADIRIYVTDNNKVTNETGWTPSYTPTQIMEEIFVWLQNNEHQLKKILA